MKHREIIDVHAHIGAFEGYDLSLPTLLAETREAGIALALVSNIDGASVPGKTRGLGEAEANEATAAFVRAYPDRFRGLLWGRPDRGDTHALEARTGLQVEGQGPWTPRLFVGMKLHPEMNQVAADAPAFDPYLALAGRHRLPVVIHCDGVVDEASAPRILALARRHPTVPVVLYHTGFQGPHEPAMAAAETALADGSAELWLETAQLSPERAVEAVERVGPGRVLFGTDATFFGRGHYTRYEPLLEALHRTLSPDALDQVLSGNARSLFRLGAGEDPGPSPGTSDQGRTPITPHAPEPPPRP